MQIPVKNSSQPLDKRGEMCYNLYIIGRGASCHQYFACKRLSEAGQKKGAGAEDDSWNRVDLAAGNKIPLVVAAMRSAIGTKD